MTVAVLLMLTAFAQGGGTASKDFPDVQSLAILPSATDPAIKEFDTDHTLYWSTKAKTRDELVVFIPGTGGRGSGAVTICKAAASFGYRVLNLSYPGDIPAAIVRDRPDRDAFLNFRLEIIEGRDLSDAVSVDRTNSLENRLIKTLLYLREHRPTEGWDKYLTPDGEIRWEKIIPAGHSQGAGHAALIGIRHKVARVVMTGGPRDYDRAADAPAGWYTTPATPIDRFFTFDHVQDQQGCTYEELLKNCRALGMEKLGKPVDVDTVPSPFRNSRILTTNYPVPDIDSVRAHVSVISDALTPRTNDGQFLFKPVWEYMYTTPVAP
jgi:pimeloyl-ACP methyl ester carboxylesterase